MIQKYQILSLNILTDNKIKEKQLFNESNIFRFINNFDLEKKIATLATNEKLKAKQEKILKLQGFDSSCFRSKSHFEDDGAQNYLVFQST